MANIKVNLYSKGTVSLREFLISKNIKSGLINRFCKICKFIFSLYDKDVIFDIDDSYESLIFFMCLLGTIEFQYNGVFSYYLDIITYNDRFLYYYFKYITDVKEINENIPKIMRDLKKYIDMYPLYNSVFSESIIDCVFVIYHQKVENYIEGDMDLFIVLGKHYDDFEMFTTPELFISDNIDDEYYLEDYIFKYFE